MANKQGKKRPNVLIIMSDQMNASILSCYGGQVSVPNLERLARRGVVFTNATCTTPFCSPSRASLVTGLYPHRHGIVYNCIPSKFPSSIPTQSGEGITMKDATTERILNTAGYATYHSGIWALSPDTPLTYYPSMYGNYPEYDREMASVFREVRKLPRANWMEWYTWALPVQISPAYQEATRALGDKWKSVVFAEFVTKAGRLNFQLPQMFDVRVADRTIERIANLGSGPFMFTCSFQCPHDPNVVPSPYYEAFVPDEIALPANFGLSEARFANEWSRQMVADLGEVGLRELLRIYCGSIKLVDDQVGRVLNALDRTGQTEDTIVVFTSDHGDMAGGHGMFWKSTSSFYDEIVRVPLIISYPRQIKPGLNGMAASLVDMMPTLLDLVGLPIPQGVQGQSLAPYLLGKRDPAQARPYSFCERVHPNPQQTRRVAPGVPSSFMIRGQGWKYIRYPDGEEFLYDLAKDPGETNNVNAHPSYLDQKSILGHELEVWLEKTGYPQA
jgi:arylsulfatase A-like enzyme